MEEFKIITYNIDGLPETLDLNTLPWILRPIAWIYKLFKGTTIVTVNDGTGKAEKIKEISKDLSHADIVCVQEDFNYHEELTESLKDFESGTYMGGFDLSKVFSMVKWLPIPRFKADGLGIFVKKPFEIASEEIIPWDKSYGYFTHANDKLTMKGFRHYVLKRNGKEFVEVYVVHMDADFYDTEKCPDVSKDIEARKCQLQQLTSNILSHEVKNPIIVIGDTNSSEKYEWDRENIEKYLLEPINSTSNISIKELIPSNYRDVDRIFYISKKDKKSQLTMKECLYNLDNRGLSDHYSLETSFYV